MELYSNKDIEFLKEKHDELIDKIEEKKSNIYEPTKKELMDAVEEVIKFVRSKKRKIYGGTAQNEAVKMKNPKDAFYKDDIVPDIDVYSPDPINDLYELCDILYEKGFKDVQGKEKLHKETYGVFVNMSKAPVCDLSYVPRNVYNKIPFFEKDGLIYTHPSFTMIDLYKIMSEPYFSSFRWCKVPQRLQLLQKHYPFNPASKPIPSIPDFKGPKGEYTEIANFINGYITNNEKVICIGIFAYNCFLQESEWNKYKYIDVPFYQLVLIDYKETGRKMINKLREKYKEITVVEHYPLWQVYGQNAIIYHKDVKIAHIYDYWKRCTPVKKIIPREFIEGKVVMGNKKDFIQLACYDYMLYMNMALNFYCRVNDLKEICNYYNIMLSHLVEMRNYYFKKHKNGLFDNTIFEEFIIDCIGYGEDPVRTANKIRMKKEVFKYKPPGATNIDWQFANTSGNSIKNEKNLKLTDIKFVEYNI